MYSGKYQYNNYTVEQAGSQWEGDFKAYTQLHYFLHFADSPLYDNVKDDSVQLQENPAYESVHCMSKGNVYQM